MLFRRTVLAVGIVVATSLPMAGTATAKQGPAAGQITATYYYSSGWPAMVSLDPVSGDVTRTFAQNAEDGVLSPNRSTVAYIQHDDTCIPQFEGCMYAQNLVVAKADGSNQHVLVRGVEPETGNAPYVAHPRWSPDGKRILYYSPRGLEWVKSDGTGQEVLTTGVGVAAISPDGKSIAFVKTTVDETADGRTYDRDVWVMDIATRQMRQISTLRYAQGTPVWSPDGQRIVVDTAMGLSAIDVATGAVTDLQSDWPIPLTSIRSPVFSPDGTRIAFNAVDGFDYTNSTYVVDADGKNLRVLTDQPVIPSDWVNK